MLLYWIIVSILWVFVHLVWRIEIIGRENLQSVRNGNGWVVASNHISNIDPVFIVVCIYDLSRMRVLAKAELFKNAFAAFFFRCMGAVAVDRGKGDTTVIDMVTEECRNGKGVLIFAEGTRTKDGYLGKLKSGAFVIAGAANAAMVPCRIIYNTPDGRARPFCRVRICFGEPIPAEALQITDQGHKMAALRNMKNRLSDSLEGLIEQHYFPAPAFDARRPAPAAKQPAAAVKPATATRPAVEEAPSVTLDAPDLASPHLDAAITAAQAQTTTPKGE